jgi:hypothetical protein
VSELREDEPDVTVIRSSIDPDIWICYAVGDAIDLSDFAAPGRIQAVKRYTEQRYACGSRVRWERVDEDTWRMRLRVKS